MARSDYNCSIKWSSQNLTAREKIMLKDLSNAESLEKITRDGKFELHVGAIAELLVHNEHSENKDYPVYVVIDTHGNKFQTGSTSFYEALMDIWDALIDEDDTSEVVVEVYQKESKNRAGKAFITCSLVG